MQVAEKLSRPTSQRLGVLENISRYEILTVNDLAYVIYGTLNSEQGAEIIKRSIRRTAQELVQDGYLHAIRFLPKYEIYGQPPFAFWLSEKGEEYCIDRFPATDPKSYYAGRSDLMIPHDLKRARTHIAIAQMCERKGWELGWRKTDLAHIVKPDDVFEITKDGRTYHFFLEQENTIKRMKSHDEDKRQKGIYDKLEPYVKLRGSDEMLKQWGFQYYTLIVPMRDETAKTNLLAHLNGGCDCQTKALKEFHARGQFKLDLTNIRIVTADEIIENPQQLFLDILQ